MRRRALAALAAAGLVALLAATGHLRGLERATYDARLQLRGAHPSDRLAIVAIDDATLNAPGQHWPLRRSLHARAIDRLRRAGAERIVYDVQFTEPSAHPRDDMMLLRAVARAPGTVLATGESDGRGRTKVLGGDRRLRRIGATAAAANLPAHGGGVIRRYVAEVNGLPSIAARIAPTRGGLIDFRGPAGTFPTYSFGALLDGKVPDDALRGRIVVVGATAATLQDLHPTAAGGDRLMSGPEIQANAIWTALHGSPLRPAPGWIGYALLLLAGLAAGAVRSARRAGLALAGGLAYAGVAQAAFAAGVVLPAAVPLVGLLGAISSAILVTVATETRGRLLTTRELALTQLEAVDRLARAAEMRDDDTGEHINRMSRLCERVALELGHDPAGARLLRQAAALHDVGKIALPDSILRKPGKLTPEEIEVMRRHTTGGAALLDGSRSPLLRLAEVIARTHHERWDGSGYPAGLAGEEIPMAGRIAAVCDVYDALVSARPYKRAWTVAEAVAEVEAQRGRHFEPRVADALLAVVARQTSEAASESGVPSTAASALSTEVATQVNVGVSRFV